MQQLIDLGYLVQIVDPHQLRDKGGRIHGGKGVLVLQLSNQQMNMLSMPPADVLLLLLLLLLLAWADAGAAKVEADTGLVFMGYLSMRAHSVQKNPDRSKAGTPPLAYGSRRLLRPTRRRRSKSAIVLLISRGAVISVLRSGVGIQMKAVESQLLLCHGALQRGHLGRQGGA